MLFERINDSDLLLARRIYAIFKDLLSNHKNREDTFVYKPYVNMSSDQWPSRKISKKIEFLDGKISGCPVTISGNAEKIPKKFLAPQKSSISVESENLRKNRKEVKSSLRHQFIPILKETVLAYEL